MLYDKLYDWQKEIVDFVSTKRLYGLWLDCGLGKTVQALALAEKNKATKIMIVTPNAKACETVDTPGSWHRWARELGDDFVIRRKDGAAVWAGGQLVLGKEERKTAASKKDTSDNNQTYEQTGAVNPNKKSVGEICLTVSASKVPKTNNPANNPANVWRQYEKTVWIVNYESLFDHKATGTRPVLKDTVLGFIASCREQNVTLLLDESHYIKDPSSKQTLALQSIKRELMMQSLSFHSYLLTGTPFTRGFIDVFNQLKFLGCQMTKTEFREKFCVLGNVRGLLGWQQPIVGYRNIDALYALMHQYAITLKSNDVIHLPDQIFTDKMIPKNPWFTLLTREKIPVKTMLSLNKTREKLGLPTASNTELQIFTSGKNPLIVVDDKWYKNASIPSPWFRDIDFPSSKYICDTPGSLWLRARQLSIGFQGNAEDATWYDKSRLDAIKTFLENNPDNYVLFYNYVPEFLELFDICVELGYNVDVYNGEIKSLSNYERYEKLSPDAKTGDTKNIILSNFASGSTGMNWQEYSNCIIASLPTYKHWAQGLKRVHRSGSRETVNYYVFKSDNWLDSGMWQSLMNGEEYSEAMFNKALNEAQPEFQKEMM